MNRTKWLIVLISALLLLAVVVIAGYIKMKSTIKSEFDSIEPKEYALNLALNNQELKDLIGEPISIDSLNYNPKREGQMQLKLGVEGIDFSANAVNLEIPLKGQRSAARLLVIAEKKDEDWSYKTIEVREEGSDTVINLKEIE